MKMEVSFFKDKKILITGHTGFKGSWMCGLLLQCGAKVTGYALKPPTTPNLFEICRLSSQIDSVEGDIRDFKHIWEVFNRIQPEIVIHMAAQPLVRESYRQPAYTYDVNVMGTVNILECIRKSNSVKSFLNVTTDKVYLNHEWEWGYRENEVLNGYDPYSNSKSCSELVTSCYLNSFFQNQDVAISTARAGNVIGGGDFSADRIIPDCIRAVQEGRDIVVRNPFSRRPYQHVLEAISAYLMIVMEQYKDKEYAGSYNVGPDETDCWTTGDLVALFCRKWNNQNEASLKWVNQYDGGPHEASYLKLDCSRIKNVFHWKPKWNVDTAMDKIVEWTRIYFANGDVRECMKRQIQDFLEDVRKQ